MKTLLWLAFIFTYSCICSGQGSTSIVTQSNGMQSPKKTSDKDFIYKAFMGGLLEAELGKAAKIRSSNQRVKNYGDMMAHDHTIANDNLKSIAESKNIKVPDRLDSDHQKMIDMMKEKSSSDFDKAYIEMMVSDHKKDIKEFEEAGTQVSDADVKAFANKTLPTLKVHLD